MSKSTLRLAVSKRARGCCEYCKSQEQFSSDPFSMEHITPRKHHGSDDESNLAFSCQGCNNNKYTSTKGLDPLTGEDALLFHPRRQRWGEHYVWNEDFSSIIGKTPTGRATVAKLKLNRDGVVNMRRVLVSVGKHPA